MPITKPSKSKPKNAHIIDSKPVQLAKLMYAGIVRYSKAKNSQNIDKTRALRLTPVGQGAILWTTIIANKKINNGSTKQKIKRKRNRKMRDLHS